MYTNTCETKITNIEHEPNSEVIWIDRIGLADGKSRSNCIPVAPWGDANALVRAAKVIARLTW